MGVAAAAMALLLVRQGVRVLAIDKRTALDDVPRAIALDHFALRILQSLGVRDDELALTGVTRVDYDSSVFGRLATIVTATTLDGHPRLVTLQEPELERELRHRLRDLPRADVRFGAELLAFSDDGRAVHARLRGASGHDIAVRAGYLVAADGADSMVRSELGLTVGARRYQPGWPGVDMLPSQPAAAHLTVPCDRGGQRTPDVLAAPHRNRFPGRAARRFSQGRCFLVGNAAHVTPALPSDGVARGLRDAANLAWRLSAVVRHGLSSELLATYDVERRLEKRRASLAARIVRALTPSRPRMARTLAHGAVALTRRARAARAFLDHLQLPPADTLVRGLFVRQGLRDRLGAGALFPQGWIRTPSMPQPRLSDEAIGDGWSLIAFGDDPHATLTCDLARRWEAAGGRIWQWCHRSQAQQLGPPGTRIEALDDTVLPTRVSIGWAVIVRPDRRVFAEGPIADMDTIVRLALERLGAPQASDRADSALAAA
jgi:3-(3-hydroxy-phenyl)propionate hydroxylase